ncbi:hypothetical protein D3C87_130530 [compost metagenome]
MEKKKNIKNKWLHVRLDEDEHRQLMDQFAKTTERKLGRYARKVLLGNPVVSIYRNQSLDDIIVILTKLQKDLNGVANNYNQMVHKLHISDTKGELKAWVNLYEKDRQPLFDNIQLIKDYISKTGEKWLR